MHHRENSIYMTLLLRGLCVFCTFEKQKGAGYLGVGSLRYCFFDFFSYLTGYRLTRSLLEGQDHGSALGSLGKGAFLGALAIPGFLDTGAALTGMAGDALGDDDGAGA